MTITLWRNVFLPRDAPAMTTTEMDERGDVWDLRDPADLLRRMNEDLPFVAGELRLAAVKDPWTDGELLGQVRVSRDATGDLVGRGYESRSRRRDMLSAAVAALPSLDHGRGRPPWTTVVTVSVRRGRVVPSAAELAWFEAMHFCNAVSLREMLKADLVLVTEHGWSVLRSGIAGATPTAPPPLVSAARRRSSSHACSG